AAAGAVALGTIGFGASAIADDDDHVTKRDDTAQSWVQSTDVDDDPGGTLDDDHQTLTQNTKNTAPTSNTGDTRNTTASAPTKNTAKTVNSAPTKNTGPTTNTGPSPLTDDEHQRHRGQGGHDGGKTPHLHASRLPHFVVSVDPSAMRVF